MGWGGIGSLGLVEYRAPYGANNSNYFASPIQFTKYVQTYKCHLSLHFNVNEKSQILLQKNFLCSVNSEEWGGGGEPI